MPKPQLETVAEVGQGEDERPEEVEERGRGETSLEPEPTWPGTGDKVDGHEICRIDVCSSPSTGAEGHDKVVWCVSSNDCKAKAGCDCHLFRADGKKDDPEWKHYADPGKKKAYEDPANFQAKTGRYYYRCFCAKKA